MPQKILKMNHSEVAHRWYNEQRAYGRGHNMFYQDNTIFSYGHHFVLGHKLSDGSVILNTQGYSVSTQKHKSITRGAINSSVSEILRVPLKPRCGDLLRCDKPYQAIDFDQYVRDFNTELRSLGRARKPQLYIQPIRAMQFDLKQIFKKFRGSKTFALKSKGMRKLLAFVPSEELLNKAKESARKYKKIEAEKKIRIEKKRADDIAKWVSGDTNYLPFFLSGTFIRVKDGFVETSKGKKIRLSDACRIMKLWIKGSAVGATLMDSTNETWTCIKSNGVIKFGCHEISKDHAMSVLKDHIK